MSRKTLAAAREGKPDDAPEAHREALQQRRAEAADVLAETLLGLWLAAGQIASAMARARTRNEEDGFAPPLAFGSNQSVHVAGRRQPAPKGARS